MKSSVLHFVSQCTLCLKKRHWHCTLYLQHIPTDFNNFWQICCWESTCYPICPD